MQIAPYGSWQSPITSDLIVAGTIGLGGVCLDGEDIYWSEQRPSEAGRSVIVRRSATGQIQDVTPPPFNVRSRVHEYGGGAYLVHQGTVYFVNYTDQRLYRQQLGEPPVAITPETAWRYADGVLDRGRDRLIIVREDHTGSGEAVNTIVAVPLESGPQQIIVSGSDFYAAPRISPDGQFLTWLSWNHPNMPWDGTELWLAEITPDGSLANSQQIAGGVRESILQPEWSGDGRLYFVSDRTNWWNLYRWSGQACEALCPMEAEFGSPLWVFGISNYAFDTADRLICTYSQEGVSYLASLDTCSRQLHPISLPYTEIAGLHASNGRVVFQASSATKPAAIVQLTLASNQLEVLRRASSLPLDPENFSVPQSIKFPTEHGLTAYGFFYQPTNKNYTAPAHQRPPLLVKSHGGPTAATSTAFNLKI
ncbi:MAG TPA: S9 family peptidase, partial [Coleofasciculaceae cyanobacterium]